MAKSTLLILIIVVSIIFFIGYWIYISRNHRRMLVKMLGTVLVAFLAVLFYSFFLQPKPGITNLQASAEKYVMKINETKSINGTHIKLYNVFMDLQNIQASYSVQGKYKVVAIELKRKLEDVEALSALPGLWIGRRLLPEYSSFGMAYSTKSNEFIDPVYIVFYFSDGSTVSFEVKDEMNVKSKVKVMDIDKIIEFDDSSFTFKKGFFGLNYSSISFESDFMPTNIKITIIDGETTLEKSPGWSGGGNKYVGYIWFDPVKTNKLQIKIKDPASKKDEMVEINVR